MTEENEEISQRVLSILREHQAAGCTFMDIAEYCLKIQMAEELVDKVTVTLDSLIKEGRVKTIEKCGNTFFVVHDKTL